VYLLQQQSLVLRETLKHEDLLAGFVTTGDFVSKFRPCFQEDRMWRRSSDLLRFGLLLETHPTVCQANGVWMYTGDASWPLAGIYIWIGFETYQINVPFFQLHLSQSIKTSANKWMPGLYDMIVDFCALADRNSEAHKFIQNFYSNLSPKGYSVMLSVLQPCPYTKPWKLDELVDSRDVVMTKAVGKIFGSNEFKLIFRIFDRSNRTVFGARFYSWNTGFMAKKLWDKKWN
jgi:hypothetical protein